MKNHFGNEVCACGRMHINPLQDIIVERGALGHLAACVQWLGGKHVFILADRNTYKAAGEKAIALLQEAGIAVSQYIINADMPEPDERTVGEVAMHYNPRCDLICAVGSGVINDIGKILSHVTGNPYMIVATAPSMDGYASATSSMVMDGLKVSLPTRCADIVLGDIDILKEAPERLLRAGLGDMLAKYISICEWRIANRIMGEYYCEEIASLIRKAVKSCAENAEGLLKREPEAVKAVFEGLVLGGIAMAYAGVSRPASGVEHYFSHVWDIRGLAKGTPVDLHGTQCAVGTFLAARLYEKVKKIRPEREKALAYAAAFDYTAWSEKLKEFVGKGADAMIALEAKEQKYDRDAHAKRLEVIIEAWDDILAIIGEEVPPAAEIEGILHAIGAPCSMEEIGQKKEDFALTFQASKDIRDKYVLSRLAWDLGVTDTLLGEDA